MMSKKTNYKILMEAFTNKKVKLPTKSVDHRPLTEHEIKDIIREEFGKAKEAAKEKVQEPEGGWGDAELEKEIEWMKDLGIKEFFDFGKNKKKKK